ncbi:hypothetical protein ON010_g4038 [Phytophthora cinnamomi]|nr:hypothetical protein ON010_g4038 [Phytophthora cinnamomi]
MQQESKAPLWKRLEERWNESQVGRQGSYSMERLESLDLYCKTTSRVRVILCLPLRHPSEGWAANWVFWVRLLVVQTILGFGGNSQTSSFVPDINFTPIKRLTAAFLGSSAHIATNILVAATIGFPVPFMMQFGAVPVGIYMPLMIRLILGPGLFTKASPFKAAGDRINRFFFAHMTLIGVYPIYKVVYSLVPAAYDSIVVIILPIWKFAAESYVVHATRELEDCIPEFVAFSVDFFGTLLVSVCMYTSRSLYLSGLFILLHVCRWFVEYRDIKANAKIVRELLRERRNSLVRLHAKGLTSMLELLSMITAVVRSPKTYRVSSLRGARLWLCLSHPITLEQARQLGKLELSGVYDVAEHSANSVSRKNQQYLQPRLLRIAVAPVTPDAGCNSAEGEGSHAETINANRIVGEKSETLTLQGLQLLFHCEYLTLVQYVECVIPRYGLDSGNDDESDGVCANEGGLVPVFERISAEHVLVFPTLPTRSLRTFLDISQDDRSGVDGTNSKWCTGGGTFFTANTTKEISLKTYREEMGRRLS